MRPRLRQLAADLFNRIFVVPLLFVLGGVALSWATLQLDGSALIADMPATFTTTVESSRTLMSTIAGGLIASVTLLLSLVLVAVQLSNAQFSPRTLRKWTGDKMLQAAIGVVLGTTMFCLLVLRNTGRVNTDDASQGDLVPHVSVLVGLALGMLSLVMVLKAVDHLTDSLRIGSVVKELTARTVDMVDQERKDAGDGSPEPCSVPGSSSEVDERGTAIESDRAGWIQQIDFRRLHRAAPAGSTLVVAAPLGSFVLPGSPLVWVLDTEWTGGGADGGADEGGPTEVGQAVREAIAVGDTRTMSGDIGFGILQLVDIALRALSPGVNDPNTAVDVVRSLSVVLRLLWEAEPPPEATRADDVTVVVERWTHDSLLHAAYEPILGHCTDEPIVLGALTAALEDLRSEVVRLDLAGGVEPIDRFLERLA